MNYYNINSDVFFQQTYDVDMQSLYQPFLRYLPEKSLILDLGCGSGRDTLAFMQQGYQVEAIDSSVQLVELANQYTGLNVRLESFMSYLNMRNTMEFGRVLHYYTVYERNCLMYLAEYYKHLSQMAFVICHLNMAKMIVK